MLINAWDPCQQCLFFFAGQISPNFHLNFDMISTCTNLDFSKKKYGPNSPDFKDLKKIQIARFL
jgi:hypothetical protein